MVLIKVIKRIKINDKTLNSIETLDIFNNVGDIDGIPGIMIYDSKTGLRIKFRNKRYEYIRRLKKNTNKEQFLYYSLRYEKAIKEFLNHFPEKANSFKTMNKTVCDWTNQLYSYYISCFIKKEKHVKQYPYQYVPHLCNLHGIYLNDLRPIGQKMHKNKVITYVNNLKPEQLMFAINYDKRPKHQKQTKPSNQTANEISQELSDKLKTD